MSEHSRRTVVRGAAWSVPVIALAAQAPAFAVSPVTILIDFSGACANTGTPSKGCGTPKSLQVPLTVDNSFGSTAITFQIMSMFTSNASTAPTAVGTGVAVGVEGIFATTFGFAAQNVCNTPTTPISPTTPTCTGGIALVTVEPFQVGTFFIVATSTGSSSQFSTTINYRLLDASCNPIAPINRTDSTIKAISPANCSGAENDSGPK